MPLRLRLNWKADATPSCDGWQLAAEPESISDLLPHLAVCEQGITMTRPSRILSHVLAKDSMQRGSVRVLSIPKAHWPGGESRHVSLVKSKLLTLARLLADASGHAFPANDYCHTLPVQDSGHTLPVQDHDDLSAPVTLQRLRRFGWCAEIAVKGKGMMQTYLWTGSEPGALASPRLPRCHCSPESAAATALPSQSLEA